MILKGSELAALAFSSVSLVALTVGMTAAVMTGQRSDTKNTASPKAAQEEKIQSGALRFELWDAFEACKNKMQESDDYKIISSFMDAHSSRLNPRKNTHEVYLSADIYTLDKGKIQPGTSTLQVHCEVSVSDNAVMKYKSRVKRS